MPDVNLAPNKVAEMYHRKFEASRQKTSAEVELTAAQAAYASLGLTNFEICVEEYSKVCDDDNPQCSQSILSCFFFSSLILPSLFCLHCCCYCCCCCYSFCFSLFVFLVLILKILLCVQCHFQLYSRLTSRLHYTEPDFLVSAPG